MTDGPECAESSGPAVAEPVFTPIEQLSNYASHAKVFEQVTALTGHLATTINLYILATGGIWAFIFATDGGRSWTVIRSALIMHVALSAATAGVCFGLAQTARQRLHFLNALGKRYWKSIEELGVAASGKAGRWGLRRQLILWPSIPALGGIASLALVFIGTGDGIAASSGCPERLRRVEVAANEVELDRAIFLFSNARCGSGRAAQSPARGS